MPNQPNDSTKRRPVDALFGEKDSHASPDYVVQAPQPVTTVSPPAPDETTVPAPAPMPPPPSAPRSASTFSQPLANAPTINPMPATPAPTHPAPLFDPEPVIARPIVALNQDRYAAELNERIEKLYARVQQETSNSRLVAEYGMALLLKARQAYATQDYPSAEFHLQSVDARLQRSAASQQAARRPSVGIILLWQLGALVASGAAIAMSYIINLTLFNLPVLPEGIVLMRALAWGALGGAFGALTNIVMSMRRREYESAANLGYFARPVFGGILGGIFFLLSQAGVIAGPIVINNTSLGPLFLYVFAVLVGFKQEAVIERMGNWGRTVLGKKQG